MWRWHNTIDCFYCYPVKRCFNCQYIVSASVAGCILNRDREDGRFWGEPAHNWILNILTNPIIIKKSFRVSVSLFDDQW